MPDLSVQVVWSSQLGAEETHVDGAARLMLDPRVHHYWDGRQLAGAAFERYFPGLSAPAWDVWMLFAPGVVWEDSGPPEPTWWEHQLGVLGSTYPDRRLDPARFARKARELAAAAGRGQEVGAARGERAPDPGRPHRGLRDSGAPEK